MSLIMLSGWIVWGGGEEKSIAIRCTVQVTDCKFFDDMRYMICFIYSPFSFQEAGPRTIIRPYET